MSVLNETFGDNNETLLSMNRFPRQIRYWSYLIFNILSITCTLLTLYLMLCDRTLRNSLNNHIIIILLILGLVYELIDIPLKIHNDIPISSSEMFYLFWVFLDYTIYPLQIGLFSLATIQRHILIFHDKLVSTKMKRFFIHYIPIGGMMIYYIIYYSFVHFVPTCLNSFDSFLHGGVFIPCAFDRTFLGLWDLIVHQLIATLFIIIFSISLLIRILIQKRRMNQQIQWRKCRKMTIQLLTISTIYMIFSSPWILLIFLYQYGLPDDIAIPALMYTGYLSYYVIFLFPFVALLSLSELRSKIQKKLFCYRTQQRVRPLTRFGGIQTMQTNPLPIINT